MRVITNLSKRMKLQFLIAIQNKKKQLGDTNIRAIINLQIAKVLF